MNIKELEAKRKETDAKACALYGKKSIKEIATECGISENTVYQILYRNGISKVRSYKLLCPAAKPVAQISSAKKYRTKEDIILILKQAGLEIVNPEEFTTVKDQCLLKCLNNPSHTPFKREIHGTILRHEKKPTFILCPECRAYERIKKVAAMCEQNLELIDFKHLYTKTSSYYDMTWKCKHCEHIFTRTDDETIRGGYEGSKNCPNCRRIREANLKSIKDEHEKQKKAEKAALEASKKDAAAARAAAAGAAAIKRAEFILSIKCKIKDLGFEIQEEFTKLDCVYTLKCTKDGTILRKNLKDLLKLKNNYTCPTCRIKKVLELSPNIEHIHTDGDILGFRCKHCKYIFSTEKLENRPYDCPKCGRIRQRKLKMSVFTDHKRYEWHCRRVTKKIITLYDMKVNNKDEVFDHKFSIAKAYQNAVPPFITAYPGNLEPMNKVENNKKLAKCSITLSELYIQFGEWLKIHPEYLDSVSIIEKHELKEVS
jgi:transposase-like protein